MNPDMLNWEKTLNSTDQAGYIDISKIPAWVSDAIMVTKNNNIS